MDRESQEVLGRLLDHLRHGELLLLSSDDNGHLYRSRTGIANFPNGFTDTVIVMQDSNKYALWEAANVYKLSDSQTYLLLAEAIGSNGKRYRTSFAVLRPSGQG